MNKINQYYNKLNMEVDPEEMARRVISAQTAERPKCVAFKKPVVIAAAAAVVMVGGVTAGAVTGLFNFNEIFHSVSVEDEEFGEKLLGNADNVKTTVSNDDYVVRLKGVTGSPSALFANIEISRADGQPLSATETAYIDVKGITMENCDSFGGVGYNYAVNEYGSLDIDWEHRLGYDKLLAGEVLTDGSILLSGSVDFVDGGDIKTLDWTMEFDYTPSAESLRVAKAADVSEDCVLNCYSDHGQTEHDTVECDISAITLTSTVGVINCKLLNGAALMPSLREDNDIRLIKSDGSEIKAFFAGIGGEVADDSLNCIIRYYADNSFADELAVDLSEIKAISINGSIYELS